jgi:outer membrane protein TolC
VDAASADYGPQLNLGAQYSTIGNGGLAADSSYVGQFSTGLTLSVPLFDGGNQEAEVSRAQALKKSRELQLADLELEVTRQVVDVQARYQAAEANQKLSEDARLRAEEDLRISTMRYEVGQGDPMEVLDTLTATSRMRLSAVQAAYDANVLYADLLYFTGRL